MEAKPRELNALVFDLQAKGVQRRIRRWWVSESRR